MAEPSGRRIKRPRLESADGTFLRRARGPDVRGQGKGGGARTEAWEEEHGARDEEQEEKQPEEWEEEEEEQQQGEHRVEAVAKSNEESRATMLPIVARVQEGATMNQKLAPSVTVRRRVHGQTSRRRRWRTRSKRCCAGKGRRPASSRSQ